MSACIIVAYPENVNTKKAVDKEKKWVYTMKRTENRILLIKSDGGNRPCDVRQPALG